MSARSGLTSPAWRSFLAGCGDNRNVITHAFEAALEILRAKKNLRVLRAGEPHRVEGLEYRTITGGMLVQTRDKHRLTRDALKVVTKRAPTDEEIEALLFAWTVCKHTKSNAIVRTRSRGINRLVSYKAETQGSKAPAKSSLGASPRCRSSVSSVSSGRALTTFPRKA